MTAFLIFLYTLNLVLYSYIAWSTSNIVWTGGAALWALCIILRLSNRR